MLGLFYRLLPIPCRPPPTPTTSYVGRTLHQQKQAFWFISIKRGGQQWLWWTLPMLLILVVGEQK